LVDAVEPIKRPRGRPRRRPEFVLADRVHDADEKIREPLRRRGFVPKIARRGAGHGSGLGLLRYVVESTFAALFQFRRLRVRYATRDEIHEAFLVMACAMISWGRLAVSC
jgi:hypothetical protein